jgi:hypothetical protein
MPNGAPFCTREICSWKDFLNAVASKDRNWIFRGQTNDLELSSTLERALTGWKVDLKEAVIIEIQLLREFRRRVGDLIYDKIHNDTLYCMALMRHYGAPVRLLDCTYSPFVAAKFAIETGGWESVIYCFNCTWCEKIASELFGTDVVRKRGSDTTRNDATFRPMYLLPEGKRQKFVLQENPLYLNDRLTIQQGVFLCPGDISRSLLENIQSMEGWRSESNILKVKLRMDSTNLDEFAGRLKTMNLSSAALFPGLEGFAKSLGEQILHFRQLAKQRAGGSDNEC